MTTDIPRFERAIRCLLAIQRGEAVGVEWMMDKLRVSAAQAKRDMLDLERVLPVIRKLIERKAVLVLA